MEDQDIEEVDSFVYLGSTVTRTGGTLDDVALKINKVNAAFMALRNVWKNRSISRSTKLKIFRGNVKSILLYGSETWLFNNEVKRKLQTFINCCLLGYLIYTGLKLRVTKFYGIKPVRNLWRYRRRKWRWIGHTLRKNSDSIETSALEWNPQGRPRGTWRRTVHDEMNKIGKSWNEVKAVANNRVRWKSLTDVLCS